MAAKDSKNLPEKIRRLGKYDLIARVGEGGMAEVFLARQRGMMNFEKVVVVKVIRRGLVAEKRFVDMFFDEARTAALIKHPNVVDIYELGADGDDYFIAMEYIAGQALSKLLGLAKITDKGIPATVATFIIAEAADGLHAAHELTSITGEPLHLVHRDCTPGNIMVGYDGGVKLVDFGVARSLGKVSQTQAGQLKGKLSYASPEQLSELPFDRRHDIFALGICMWEALVGTRLFGNREPVATIRRILEGLVKPPSAIMPGISPELDEICLKALAVDPTERYQTAAEMRDALRRQLRSVDNPKGAVASYLSELLGDRIHAERRLLKRVVEAEEQADIIEIDGVVVEELSRVDSGIIPLPTDELRAGEELGLAGEATPPPIPSPLGRGDTGSMETPLPQRTETGAINRNKIMAIGAGAIAIIVLAVWVFGGSEPDTPTPTASVAFDAAPQAVERSDAVPAVVVVVVDAAVEVAVAIPDAAPTGPTRQDRQKARAKAKLLYNKAFKMYVRGDTAGAVAQYRAALELRPGYAAAYRGLGLVYEKTGHKAKAIRYFKRYLRSSPNAKDADSIRSRVSRLGG